MLQTQPIPSIRIQISFIIYVSFWIWEKKKNSIWITRYWFESIHFLVCNVHNSITSNAHTQTHEKKKHSTAHNTNTEAKKTEWRLILNADRKIFKTCIWNWFSQSQCYKPNQAVPERANSKSGKNNWKAKKTTMLWFIIEAAWPRHTTSDFVQRSNRESNVELKIGYFIKLIRSAWRTRALAHTQIQAFSITFFKLLEDYSFPREFNWHWLKLVK